MSASRKTPTRSSASDAKSKSAAARATKSAARGKKAPARRSTTVSPSGAKTVSPSGAKTGKAAGGAKRSDAAKRAVAAPSPAKPVLCHVVSHTHWDRAWYLPFEKFRLRLIEVVDCLLEIFATDKKFKHFVFDGQFAPIEDYLEMRPGRREAIRNAVRSGRLVLGPHYILPDEFLASGESLVRNLLIGHKLVAEYGKVPKVGYIPDSFGHVSQLPQILNGFGIDNFLFMRGVDKKTKALGLEFLWRGADGRSEVLAVNQFPGYGNLMAVGHAINDDLFQPYTPELACRKADALVAGMRERSHAPVFLFNNGHDHKFPQRTLTRALADINRHAEGRYRLVHSTHDKFIRDLKKARLELATHQGEMRGGIDHIILSGVFSARLYLKRLNFQCQTLLERFTEPLCAMAALEGFPYPGDQLLYAWKTLLKNHPHDDICGCSVDETHIDMIERFRHVEQVGETLRDRALDDLLFQIALPPDEAGAPLMVYNTLPWERSASVRAVVTLPAEEGGDEKNLEVVDSDGNAIPAAFAKKDEPFRSDWAWGDQRRQAIRVEFLARNLPAGGYETYRIRPKNETPDPRVRPDLPPPPPRIRSVDRGIENNLIRVSVQPDGSLDVRDRETEALLARTNIFEDRGDRGDEYDFDAIPREAPIRSNGKGLSWSVVQRNPERLTARLEQVLSVPAQIESNRLARTVAQVEIPLRTDITLYADSPRVDFRVSFVNHAKDHRLRLGVEMPGRTRVSWAESKFDVVRRPTAAPKEKWTQAPTATHPQDAWAAIESKGHGVAVFNRGLPEFEVESRENSTCYWVTLLRACGWLSRGDMYSRPCHAGPGMATPDAQCPGEHHAELALFPYEGTWRKADIPRAAHEYLAPPVAAGFFHGHRAHRGAHDKPLRHSFYALHPAPLLVSAVKQAESGKGLVFRVWNPDTEPHRATLALDRPLRGAWLVRLDEKRVKKLATPGRNTKDVAFDVGPKQIVTVELVFA